MSVLSFTYTAVAKYITTVTRDGHGTKYLTQFFHKTLMYSHLVKFHYNFFNLQNFSKQSYKISQGAYRQV